jgi:hypothetical protein
VDDLLLEKAGSTPAQWQRSGETGGGFNSRVVDSGEPKARPASGVSLSAESDEQSMNLLPIAIGIIGAIAFVGGVLVLRFPWLLQ